MLKLIKWFCESDNKTPKKHYIEIYKKQFIFLYRANTALRSWNDSDELIHDTNMAWNEFECMIYEDAERNGLSKAEIDLARRDAFDEACLNIHKHEDD